MAKRIRLTSEDLVFPQCKRTKRSHRGSGTDSSEDKDLPQSTIEEDLVPSNDRPALYGEESSSHTSDQQQIDEDSTTAQPKELKLPTPEPEDDKEDEESHLPISNGTQSPAATSQISTHRKRNRSDSTETQQQPPAPESKLPTPPRGTEAERPAIKTQKRPKKSKKEPEFEIYKDETATIDNITGIEDENFGFTMHRVHEFVDAYIRKEGFLYGEEVVEWILPMARKIDEVREQVDGTSLEEGLLRWKREKRRNCVSATRWGEVTTREWFGAEDVEELAGLVERVAQAELELVEEGNAEVHDFAQNYAKGQMTSNALMICGYCQGEGFGRERRRETEYYVRLGRAWERIVWQHFDEDVWKTSLDRVKYLAWDEWMMEKILASEGWINDEDLEVLRMRWARRHPLTVVRPALQDEPRGTMNRASGHPWAEWAFENEVDDY